MAEHSSKPPPETSAVRRDGVDRPPVVDRDGRNLPAEFRELPPGQYVVEPVDNPTALSPEEEDGIIAALDELDVEGGLPLAEALREIRNGSSQR
jgi:hypothetical protein